MALNRFAKRIDGHLIRGCTYVAGVTVFVQQVNVSFFVVVCVILHLINDEHVALFSVGKTVLISNALCHFFGQFFFEGCLLKSNFQQVSVDDSGIEALAYESDELVGFALSGKKMAKRMDLKKQIARWL